MLLLRIVTFVILTKYDRYGKRVIRERSPIPLGIFIGLVKKTSSADLVNMWLSHTEG